MPLRDLIEAPLAQATEPLARWVAPPGADKPMWVDVQRPQHSKPGADLSPSPVRHRKQLRKHEVMGVDPLALRAACRHHHPGEVAVARRRGLARPRQLGQDAQVGPGADLPDRGRRGVGDDDAIDEIQLAGDAIGVAARRALCRLARPLARPGPRCSSVAAGLPATRP